MKVLYYNKAAAQVWGLEEKGMEGMTGEDVLRQIPDFPNLEEELKRIEKKENEAIANTTQSVYTQTIIDAQGLIRVRKKITTPLCGKNHKPIAIANFLQDLTDHINLIYLFEIYQNFFTEKSKVVERFAKYLGLSIYFDRPCSFMELMTLLAMIPDSRHKQVSCFLTQFRKKLITPNTISNYVNAMKDKLKNNIELSMVISVLRDHGKWQVI
jgi:hypothetical protein